jgi:outer membrane murein-binding lipoprotein Lpp
MDNPYDLTQFISLPLEDATSDSPKKTTKSKVDKNKMTIGYQLLSRAEYNKIEMGDLIRYQIKGEMKPGGRVVAHEKNLITLIVPYRAYIRWNIDLDDVEEIWLKSVKKYIPQENTSSEVSENLKQINNKLEAKVQELEEKIEHLKKDLQLQREDQKRALNALTMVSNQVNALLRK